MVVVETRDGYVFVTDGHRRKLGRPKRKNIKHVSPTKTVVDLVPDCGRSLQDADIRKALGAIVLKEVNHIV